MNKLFRKVLGDKGEQLAKKTLKKQRYTIIASNYRCTGGEIDIIARHKDYLVFIEVRSKSSTQYGLPVETVDYAKQKKIKKAAQHYLTVNGLNDSLCRFDVVSIIWGNDQLPVIEVFQDAFQ